MKIFNNNILKILIFTLLHAVLLIHLKYTLNHLSISDISLLIFGNTINLLITALICSCLLIILIFPSKREKANENFLILLTYVMLIPVVLLYLAALLGISIPNGYIFNMPQRKIIFGLIFLTSLFAQLYLLQMLWGYIVSADRILFLRSLITVIVFVFSAIVLTFIYSVIFNSGNFLLPQKKYDVAVVLGAAVWSNNQPSPIFKARIKKADELFKSGAVKSIQLTGGNAPGEISEAGAAYNLLREFGVDKNKLIIEEKTSTTSEQIKYVKDNIVKTDSGVKVLIISDAFHLIRVKEMCKFYGVNADVIASGYQLNWEKYLFYSFRESISLLLFWIFAI